MRTATAGSHTNKKGIMFIKLTNLEDQKILINTDDVAYFSADEDDGTTGVYECISDDTPDLWVKENIDQINAIMNGFEPPKEPSSNVLNFAKNSEALKTFFG